MRESKHTRLALPGKRILACAIAVLLAACALLAALLLIQETLREQGTQSVRRAVLSTAVQCYAVEGSYPSSIEYLEEHYGLAVNHADYAIIYESFAANVPPTVVVTPK